jgi:hypothetical protein
MPRPRALPAPAAPRLPSAAETLGRPPLIAGEERAGYETMLARVTEAVRPDGILEEAWVRDVVDLIWDAVRLRRLKAALMTSEAAKGMHRVIARLDPERPSSRLSYAWASRDLAATGEAEAILEAAGLGIDHVMAQTLSANLNTIERIDRMAASAEARRAATLREISHWRACFAASLGAAADDAIADAEYVVVEAGAPAAAEAAAQPAADAAE